MEHFNCLLLLNSFISHDIVKKLTSLNVLHDQKKLFWCLYNFIELHDIGVPNEFKYVDLSGHTLHISHLANFGFL